MWILCSNLQLFAYIDLNFFRSLPLDRKGNTKEKSGVWKIHCLSFVIFATGHGDCADFIRGAQRLILCSQDNRDVDLRIPSDRNCPLILRSLVQQSEPNLKISSLAQWETLLHKSPNPLSFNSLIFDSQRILDFTKRQYKLWSPQESYK